jgi:diguanylate cyclase
VALVLSTRMRAAAGVRHHVLLGAAAITLAVSIWGMHFVGMLATHMPGPVRYLATPTFLSAVVALIAVTAAIALVANRPLSAAAFTAGSLLMGSGIVGMHFIGMAALKDCFALVYDPMFVAASWIVGVTASGLGLHLAFRTGTGRGPPALAALLIGLAISGMHYTAMEGTSMAGQICAASDSGLSPQRLATVVVVVAIAVALGFLVILGPQPAAEAAEALPRESLRQPATPMSATPASPGVLPPRQVEVNRAAPLGGAGSPRQRLARALPAARDGRTVYVDVTSLRAAHANGHYTMLADTDGEVLCPLPISAVEAQLDPQRFMRVHRSHLVALDAVVSIERTGDGGLARLAGACAPVPISRARYQALRARLAAHAKGQEV